MKKVILLIIVLICLVVVPLVLAPPPLPPPSPGSLGGGSSPIPVLNATCNDGVQNQDETGIDCGGSCPLCVNGTVPSTAAPSTTVTTQPTTTVGRSGTASQIVCPKLELSDEDIRGIVEMYAPQKSNVFLNLSFLINSFLIIGLVSFVLYNNIQIKKAQ